MDIGCCEKRIRDLEEKCQILKVLSSHNMKGKKVKKIHLLEKGKGGENLYLVEYDGS